MNMKNKVSTLKANIFYNILYQLLVIIVPLITAPYISRVIGKEGMGIYGYTFSIAHYFVVFIMLGILNYGNREISAVKQNERFKTDVFWNIYAIQFFMGVFLLSAYFLFVMYLCSNYRMVFFSQAIYILSGILDISWFYFGIEKFKLTAGISSLNKILTTVCIFLFVRNPNDIAVYTLIISLGALANNILYWLLLKNYIKGFSLKFDTVSSHVKPVLILFLPVIAINIYRYISKVMLGSMSGVSEVGIYDAAEKFVNLPLGVIAAIGTVMLSRITSLHSSVDSINQIKKYNRISMAFVMIVGIGVVFGLAGISNVFIPFFYGNEFTSSSNVLLLLLPSILFICWANVIRTQYLLPNRKDKYYCLSVVWGAIVNVILNILLIPRLGAIGAAIATTFAEMSVCLLQSWYARKNMNLIKYLSDIAPYGLFGILMYIIVINVSASTSFLTILFRLFSGFIFYTLLGGCLLKRKWVLLNQG